VELKGSGTLYVVATPIGNLEDISARAIRILREVDLIACEDTRHTRKLLDRYGISRPLVSYHQHNEQPRALELLGDLQAGKNIAIVSDAGTPLIADPGYRLVEQARQQGFAVTPVPGACALIAALSASGLPTDSFLFQGFLPARQGQRRKLLTELKSLPATLVFYEAPHRILETLQDVAATLGERPVVLARELTKIHEEFLRGTPRELQSALSERPSMKGEFTVMVARGESSEVDDTPLAAAVEKLMESGVPRMDALKTVARNRGISKREVYKKMHERE